ncbi:hypothetical protein ACE1OC_39815 [Streptomyces sp. DSM 116496]|uniref:hypothetical protein n=1 Tax=Streptomyces stoeckheimensis TaxID=3344656 RepID=UPI0038B2DE8C
MDRCEGTARLEWWANASTCLVRVSVEVTATSADAGAWEAVISPPLDLAAREILEQLIDADPCFTLRFDGFEGADASVVLVQAEGFDGLGLDHLRLVLIPGL